MFVGVNELRRCVVLWLGWTAIAVLSYTRHYLLETEAHNRTGFWPDLFIWLACYYAWIPLAPLIFRLEKRLRSGKSSWLRFSRRRAFHSPTPLFY